ncbi:hypothetical protein P171DRAFT_241894 [Karstenula rhodostoma CBS 690.94]|uniref:Uncharacterized protein n=1 Tax=Karstenula rhodostoma CBS 690.94 TaxID=1392251 RepID=A0A9P4PN06_9PLEO|nr:hypothetical protein P171DRAFT_241894 [Karstenula rhodostoma CBS 690.94]
MSFHETPHCLRDTVFCVYHHFAIPQGTAVDYQVEIRTLSLGVYSSFFTAQAVAVSALELNLKRLQSAGFKGKFCNDIDLWRRGLITQITEYGQERPLSEYEIQAIPLQDCAVPGDPFLGVSAQQIMIPKPIASSSSKKMPPTASEIAQDPFWAQSRIPYFRKRDEGPFRSLDDPPYAINFSLNIQISEACKQAATGGGANDNDNARAGTNIPQQDITPDRILEAQTKPEYTDFPEKQRSKQTEKEGANGEKRLGGGKDIGPIYHGRRHSTSLD